MTAPFDYPHEFDLLFRIFLAILCGALLGYERERHGISAGLRTNLLVCAGSALIMIISKYFYFTTGELPGDITLTRDPARIAAQIVTGIGFLGAGVIIKDRGSIRGLTTAATLWFNSGVGMALGVGMVVIPIFCTITGVIALSVLKKLHFKIPRETYKDITISCSDTDRDSLSTLIDFFKSKNLSAENIGIIKIKKSVHTYKFTFKCDTACIDIVSCVRELSMFDFVQKIKTN